MEHTVPDIDNATRTRLQLLANGYTPLPNVTKRCTLSVWSTIEVSEELVRLRWSRMRAYRATGMRLMDGTIGAADFDIQDKAAMDAIAQLVLDRFDTWGAPNNPLLRRIGRPPKEVWLFKPRVPFGKMLSKVWVPPHIDMNDKAAVDASKCQLELFGGLSGQIGAFGPHSYEDDDHHKAVLRTYEWPDDSPLDVPADKVPWFENGGLEASELCGIVDRYFEQTGWQQSMRYKHATHDGGAVCILNDEMVFFTPEGVQMTLSDLEDVAEHNGARFMLSPVPWLRDGSESNSGIQVGRNGAGDLTLYDHMSNTTYMREAEMTEVDGEPPRVVTQLAERMAEHKLLPPTLGLPTASFEQRRAPARSQGDIALRFVNKYGDEMRYVEAWGWMRWDGKVWLKDDKGTAYDRAHQLCCESVTGATPTEAKGMTARSFAWAVVDLVKVHPKIASDTTAWDRDPWLLNTPEGLVDLRTGGIGPHRPGAGITKITAVAPGGACPRWMKFIERSTGGDAALQEHYKRACGYALTGLTTEHALFFMHGTGGNGKTTFIEAVGGIMGTYHAIAPTEMLMATRGDRHPTELAMLVGARLVTATETEEGRHWAEAKLKQLTGGDRIAARFMRMDFFEYRPQFKLMVMGNHKPMLYSVDEAIRRRMNLWPFTVTISAAEKQADLSEILKAEWPGILRWMVEGCLLWAASGLAAPESVKAATDDYLNNEDVFGQWLAEETVRKTDAFLPASRLFARWRQWAEDRGENVGSMKKLVEKMLGRGYLPKRTNQARGFEGIYFSSGGESEREKMAADNVTSIASKAFRVVKNSE